MSVHLKEGDFAKAKKVMSKKDRKRMADELLKWKRKFGQKNDED